MTLVLSCLTRDAVYQVSDRRLTSFTTPRTVIDDDRNKAVFVGGRVAFGYTGLAEIKGQRADLWLVDVISRQNIKNMKQTAEAIRDEATGAFRRMAFAQEYKRHAFQGVGWFANNPKDRSQLEPGILTIHNALDSKGDWLPYANPQFSLATAFPSLRQNQFHLSSVGYQCTLPERDAVRGLIRKCVRRGEGRDRAIILGMAISIAWLSERTEPNSTIGRNLMALVIPKVSVEKHLATGRAGLTFSATDNASARFYYLPERRSRTIYGPHVVTDGGAFLHFTIARNTT